MMKTENLYEPFNEAQIEVLPESGKKTAISIFAALAVCRIVSHFKVRPHEPELSLPINCAQVA